MFSEVTACYLNADWRERGQAIGYVVREMRDGSLAMTTFLIDLWCAGLKDIWAKFELYNDEVDDSVKRTRESMGSAMVRVPVEDIRRLLTAAVRFARQNGFRLPSDWQKCAVFVGGLDEIDSADLTGFGWEGDPNKLHWCAPLHDLRSRLIGCSAEEFLRRPNVHYTMEIGGNEQVDEEPDKVLFRKLESNSKRFIHASTKLASEWLTSIGETPDPKLFEASIIEFARPWLAKNASAGDKAMEMMEAVIASIAVDLLHFTGGPEDMEEHANAIDQFCRWMDSFPSGEAAIDAVNAEMQRMQQSTA